MGGNHTGAGPAPTFTADWSSLLTLALVVALTLAGACAGGRDADSTSPLLGDRDVGSTIPLPKGPEGGIVTVDLGPVTLETYSPVTVTGFENSTNLYVRATNNGTDALSKPESQ